VRPCLHDFAALLIILAHALTAPANALEPVKVAGNIYALVGDLGQRSPGNLGNNATFGVIVTPAGVVLIDAGATAKGAAVIETEIARITDKKIITVVNSGGQDHRWLGNSHWRAKGARLIAAKVAVADQKARFDTQWMGLEQLVGKEGLAGTEARYADETFESSYELAIGGIKLN
jgi:glyoxylase-like metal-dependent hydrolase (beta-lactamase superfamily II)